MPSQVADFNFVYISNILDAQHVFLSAHFFTGQVMNIKLWLL